MGPKVQKIAPMPAEGMREIAARWAGTRPLPVLETQPGVYLSAWAIHQKDARRFLKENKTATLQVVVDTNVPGHPTISLMLVPVVLVKG